MTEALNDIRATMAATFDKLHEEEQPAPQAERDESGRFKSRAETPEAETPAVEAEAPAAEITDQGNEPPAEPAEQPLSPPERWSAEWKAKFTALPRDAQQVLLDREGEYDKGFTQKSQEAANLKRQIEPLNQLLEPRRQAWASEGITEQQAIGQLLQLSDYAGSQPVEFIKWFASQRGIDLQQIVGKPAEPGAPQPQSDIAPVLSEIQGIKQQLAAEKQRQAMSVIESFRQDPANTHFNDVEQDILAILPAIQRANPGIPAHEALKKAYDKAVWANDAVRERLLAEQKAALEAERQAQEAKRAKEAAEAAAKARKAAGTQLSSKSPLSAGASAPTSIRESMLNAYDKLHGTA